MKKIAQGLGFTLCALAANQALATDYSIEIQNITRGIYFTPLLVAAHSEQLDLFEAGEAASSELQAMAEGGDISGLVNLGAAASADAVTNPAQGLLAPGKTASLTLSTSATNPLLSIVAMLLPTNDGFAGLDSISLPTKPGTYTFMANGYDAGTEANDEIRGSGAPGQAGFPVPPPLEPMLGVNGSGFNATAEGFIHLHPGNLGDTNANGGPSDIDSSRHRWLSPVMRVTIKVQ